MALTPEEAQELQALEQEEAQFQQIQQPGGLVQPQGLTPEEQNELQLLEQEEAQFQELQPQPKDGGFGEEVRTFAEGAGQALTLGHLPQIQAGAQLAGDFLEDTFIGDNGEDPTFTELRDQNIRDIKNREARNPKSAIGGQVAGTLGSLLIPGGALLKGASVAAKGAKGATALSNLFKASNIAKATATGAGVGLLQNPGDVEGEIGGLQLGERLKGAGEGGALGVLFGAGGKAAKKTFDVLKGAPAKLQNFAELKAIKAAGCCIC